MGEFVDLQETLGEQVDRERMAELDLRAKDHEAALSAALPDIIEDRFRTLTTGAWRYDGTETNSELLDRFRDATREVLGRMIHGCRDDAEYDGLGHAEELMADHLTDEAMRFALKIERAREEA